MRRRLLMDLGPLRSSTGFRRLFVAQTVSMVGSQLAVVAVAFQVYSLTGSSLQVGAVSLAQLVPFLAGTLVGGGVADPVRRQRVLAGASGLSAVADAGMAANALAGPHASVVAIYLLTALAAGLAGVVSTTATAAVTSMVTSAELTPAFATLQVIDQLGMIAGPAAGGVLVAALGLPWLYGVDGLSFLWAASFLWPAVRSAAPRPEPATGPSARPASVLDGLRYLRGRQVLQGAYLVDLGATVFGLPRAVFPALVRTVFHGGPALLGLLYATPAAGAMTGTLTSGWLSAVRRPGRAVLVAVTVFGAAVALFGLVKIVWVALVLLAIAGWADVVSAVLRSTIVQTTVDDSFRSRVSGVQAAVVEGGPRLGDLESGAVASGISPRFSVVSGGIACVACTLLFGALLAGFRTLRRDEAVEPVGPGERPPPARASG